MLSAAATLLRLLLALVACGPAAAQSASSISGQAYDYVIVGGGTAGIALAVRLSQALPWAKLVVIEAGPAVSDDLDINVPGLKGSTLGGQYDWSFTTVPQPDMNDRVSFWSRGKILGGSSALNFLVYDRASSEEYAWDQLGSPGWNWRTLFPAMENSVNFSGPNTGSSVATHGPIHAVVPRYVPAQQQPFIPTVNSLGIPTNPDSQDGNPIGVEWQPSSIDPAHYNRSYSANAYLPLAGANLKVLTNTRVAKINFKQQASSSGGVPQATGVTLQNGTTITAAREVLLCAGSIQSPGLLELSGIGQAAVVSALQPKTPLLVNLPGVGENLQDHLRVQTAYQLKPNYTSFDILRYNTTFSDEQLAAWFNGSFSIYDYNGSGFIFSDWARAVGGATADSLAALARGSADNSPADQAKLSWLNCSSVPQLEIFADGYTGAKGYPAQGTPLYGQGFSTLLGVLLHPFARGSVHVNTSAADPLDAPPIIDPHYLNNRYDNAGLVEIAKLLRRIARTAPLANAFVTEYEPGYDVIPASSSNATALDALWEEYVLNVTDTLWHPTGTCALLPRAQGGVVDSHLNVYGTSSLRVVDASIIPVQLGAHMQSAVYGIAERAATLIAAAA